MRLFLRRVRGILGIAVIWSIAYALVGTLMSVVTVFGYAKGGRIPSIGEAVQGILLPAGIFWAIWGLVTGVVFGLFLAAGERGGVLATLRMRRVALWGALAGVFVPGLLSVVPIALKRGSVSILDLILFAVVGWVGSAFAAVSLKLAQSASEPHDQASMLDVAHDSPAIGSPIHTPV